jgi:hypothetical protein
MRRDPALVRFDRADLLSGDATRIHVGDVAYASRSLGDHRIGGDYVVMRTHEDRFVKPAA